MQVTRVAGVMVTYRRRGVSMNGGCCFKLFAVKATFCSECLNVKNTDGDHWCNSVRIQELHLCRTLAL